MCPSFLSLTLFAFFSDFREETQSAFGNFDDNSVIMPPHSYTTHTIKRVQKWPKAAASAPPLYYCHAMLRRRKKKENRHTKDIRTHTAYSRHFIISLMCAAQGSILPCWKLYLCLECDLAVFIGKNIFARKPICRPP